MLDRARTVLVGMAAAAAAVPSGAQTQEASSRTPSATDLATPESTFAFAQAAQQRGDIKDAIVALERLLALNPKLPNIQYELGLLYLRAGSPALARYHLQAALAAPAIPSPVRARAQEALTQAASSSGQGALTGSFVVGMRYESNANAGPDSRTVTVLGLPAVLDGSSRASPDLSGTAYLSLAYGRSLGGQQGHLIEANLDAYGSAYADRSDLDLRLVAGQIGPRFFIGPALSPRLSVRPFVSGSYQTLGGDKFLGTYGGGANLRTTFGSRAVVSATIGYTRQDFKDTPERFVSNRTGNAYQGNVEAVYFASPRLLLRAGALARRDDARATYQAYDRFGGTIGATYVVPTGKLAGPLAFSLLAAYTRSDYDAPDPSIDPEKTRADDRIEAALSLAAPMTERLSLVLTGEYIDNASRLTLYDYDNKVARVEIQYRF